MQIQKHWAWMLAAIGGLAFLARLVTALDLWSLPTQYLLNGDLSYYHLYAMILSGQAEGDMSQMIYFSPLAIAWGSLWHALMGSSVWAVIWPQIALGTGGAILIASLGRRMGGNLAGLVSGLLAAACETFIVYDIAILPTSLMIFLSVLVVWMTMWAVREVGTVRSFAYGIVLGLWIICRPNAALFIPVALVMLWLADTQTRALARAWAPAVTLTAAALVMAPVIIINTVRTGAFVPVTSASGVNLFIGNNQGSPGHAQSVFGERNGVEAYAVFTRKAEQVMGRPLNPTEVSSFWARQTWAEIADAPGKFVVLLGKKLVYGLNNFPICDSWNIPFFETEAWTLSLPWPGFGVLLPLGLLGFVVIWRRGPKGVHAVHGLAAMSFVTIMVYFVADRYRAPLTVALCIASGPAVSWLVEKVKHIRQNRDDKTRKASALRLALASMLLALMANTAFLPILRIDNESDLERLADAFLAEGRRDEAVVRLERLRRLYLERGDTTQARRIHLAIAALSR